MPLAVHSLIHLSYSHSYWLQAVHLLPKVEIPDAEGSEGRTVDAEGRKVDAGVRIFVVVGLLFRFSNRQS